MHLTVFLCVCLQEALEELEDLKQIIPTESLVYFLMGKVRLAVLIFSTLPAVFSLPVLQYWQGEALQC